jgi:SAM-dependent methyltransferase
MYFNRFVKKEEYSILFEMEDIHWWYLGHRRLFSSLLDTYCPEAARGAVLDAGCGTGGFTQWFKEYFEPRQMAGIELNPEALLRCEERGLNGIRQGSIEDTGFPDSSFDLVMSFNVLNHYEVESDIAALCEMWRVLKPGGYLLLNLPARKALRGRHDLAVGDLRRYRAHELKDKLVDVGFDPLRVTYFNATLVPLMVVYRRISRHRLQRGVFSDLWLPPTAINRMLVSLLEWESRLALKHDLPNGSSITALAQKPSATRARPEPVAGKNLPSEIDKNGLARSGLPLDPVRASRLRPGLR